MKEVLLGHIEHSPVGTNGPQGIQATNRNNPGSILHVQGHNPIHNIRGLGKFAQINFQFGQRYACRHMHPDPKGIILAVHGKGLIDCIRSQQGWNPHMVGYFLLDENQGIECLHIIARRKTEISLFYLEREQRCRVAGSKTVARSLLQPFAFRHIIGTPPNAVPVHLQGVESFRIHGAQPEGLHSKPYCPTYQAYRKHGLAEK